VKDMKSDKYKGSNLQHMTEYEKEFEEMKKIGESVGIEDLMAVYGEYQKVMQIAMQYLGEMSVKFTFSTTDSTS